MAAAAASSSSSSGRRRGSTGWLAKLQQQFEQGVHTDMVIRVRVSPDDEAEQEQQEAPAPKRRRTNRAAAAASAAATLAPDRFVDIKAHSVVLSARYDYFRKCLGGEWAEAAERRVELTVPDEQAVADLKLLVKISYSDSYTHEGEQLLPLATRLRLAVRADALEFVEGLQQLVESELDFEAAQTVLDDLPPVVEAHGSMVSVRREVLEVLAKGIEERLGEEEEGGVVQRAMQALTKYLGPVAGMFEDKSDGMDTWFTESLALRKEVRQLPLGVFKRLLTCETLQLQSENEAFPLLMAWLYQSFT